MPLDSIFFFFDSWIWCLASNLTSKATYKGNLGVYPNKRLCLYTFGVVTSKMTRGFTPSLCPASVV